LVGRTTAERFQRAKRPPTVKKSASEVTDKTEEESMDGSEYSIDTK